MRVTPTSAEHLAELLGRDWTDCSGYERQDFADEFRRVTSTMARMANHPRRNWRKQWTVDLEARVAHHEPTGAVFEFAAGLLPPASTLRNRFEVVRELTTKHGAAAAAQMVQRLQRDAVDVYQRARLHAIQRVSSNGP